MISTTRTGRWLTGLLLFGAACASSSQAHASQDLPWEWANPKPLGSSLTSVTYANGQFVAVGDEGAIITSSNGASWVAQNSGTRTHFADVAYLGGKFWAVGAKIATSTNATVWTNPNTGSDFAGRSIGSDGSRYVITASSSVRYSDDGGGTWTLVNLGTVFGWGFRWLNDILWDGARFIVVGDLGTIVTSQDGLQWSEQTPPVSSHLNAIASNGATFVTVGNGGVILVSTDGTAWSGKTSGTTSQFFDVFWDGSQFVAVGNPLSAAEDILIVTSPDGEAWTTRDADFRAAFNGVVGNGSTWVAVGFDGNIATSNDGANWLRISQGTTKGLSGVTYNGSLYVAVGLAGAIETSINGRDWSDHELPGLQDLNAVAWGNGLFVAVGNFLVVTSPDGSSWTPRRSSFGITFRDVIWAGSPLNSFVAAGPGNNISTSPDGLTWTDHSIGLSSTQRVDCLAWNGTQLVAAGGGLSVSDRFVATSTDATTWNITPFNGGFADIIWDGTRFVAVTAGSAIFTSPDGNTWTNSVTQTPSSALLFGLVWDTSQYTAVGRVTLHSSDASTWTAQPLVTTRELRGIVWNGHSQYVAVGLGGTILVAGDPFVPPVNQPPIARAGGPYSVFTGNGVTLDGSASSDPNDTIASYAWDIAGQLALEGATPTLNSAQVSALGAGTHAVTLTVTDTLGATNANATTLEVVPLQEILVPAAEALLAAFDEASAAGTVVGVGPGKSSARRLAAFRGMLVTSLSLIQAGDYALARQTLLDAYAKIDGSRSPADVVTGSAAPQIAQMILALIEQIPTS